MTKVAVKFFRDPRDGEKALAQLKGKGYKVEEIGLLTAGKGARQSLEILEGGSVAGAGPVEVALSEVRNTKGDPAAALASLWGVSEETARYYLFGASTGGMVVSVHTDEARTNQARQIMRKVEAALAAEACPVEVSSPGFVMAERMTSTNPSDGKLSGDFRKY